jgi:hypothetical protein
MRAGYATTAGEHDESPATAFSSACATRAWIPPAATSAPVSSGASQGSRGSGFDQGAGGAATATGRPSSRPAGRLLAAKHWQSRFVCLVFALYATATDFGIISRWLLRTDRLIADCRLIPFFAYWCVCGLSFFHSLYVVAPDVFRKTGRH